jgi:cell division protein FtsW
MDCRRTPPDLAAASGVVLMKAAVTTLAFCVAALLALGLVMLYSASMNDVIPRSGGAHVGARQVGSQLVWCALGIVACVMMASLDYRLLKKFAWPIFIVAVVMLVLVLVPHIGYRIKGASRWFKFGGVSFQPSEFAKIALIIILAWYCDRYQRQMPTLKRGVIIPGALIAVMLGLIFVEPDRGTTILLAAVSGSMLLLAGVRWRFFIPPFILALVGLGVSLAQDPMRMKRIFSWLYLEEHKEGVGYQAYQAMIALGSGGWFGLGLGNGRQKLGFVPEHHTDFILSIIGEELGLIATLGVVVGFVLIVCCGVYIATHARDTFGTMLASGITLLIGLQAFINIGVVTSALPNKGLALPFISYGGSNLLAMLACIGVLFSVARQARATEFKPANPFGADEFPSAQTT